MPQPRLATSAAGSAKISLSHMNNYPKLHNAMWPGLVGKGSPARNLSLIWIRCWNLRPRRKSMASGLTGWICSWRSACQYRFDRRSIEALADKIASKSLAVGSVVAPVWPPTGGGSAMGSAEERHRFVEQVRKSCRIANKLRELGIRPYGIVRIDSATDA